MLTIILHVHAHSNGLTHGWILNNISQSILTDENNVAVFLYIQSTEIYLLPCK